ncbi:outer membrane protein assembly factor BamE [Novosphingobium sp. 9]|uniref:outer membrane protein assembly factor BamE n=1 Tax=Novosphingobium sp. 9 TaxID=2025349 RepID=UPI0021B6E730|nr:outer membrane protein assembly factor BamE [Novosphingobium sp. 9]
MHTFGRNVLATGLVLGLATLAGGCSSIRDHRGYIIDQTLVSQVEPGVDNRLSVEKTMGRPTFESQFGPKDWYYVSQVVSTPPFGRPRTTQETILRVRFDQQGNVTAVDRKGMEDVVRLKPEGGVTPTLGRHRTFLQDLFGNIGQVGAAGMSGSQGTDTTGGSGGPGTGPNGS